jgi:hypothetical protein
VTIVAPIVRAGKVYDPNYVRTPREIAEDEIAEEYGFRLRRERQFDREMWREKNGAWGVRNGPPIPEPVWNALIEERITNKHRAETIREITESESRRGVHT